MSNPEKEFIEEIDAFILNASPEDLKKFQTLDLKNQLKGIPFYDVLMISKTQDKENLSIRSNLKKSKP